MKSMRDCKTQEEKDLNMRETFLKMGCEVNKGYHYKNQKCYILFKVIDKQSKYYKMRGKIQWNHIQEGHTFDFRSFYQLDKDLYVKKIFNSIGINPISQYQSSHDPIKFIVLKNNNSLLIGLKGQVSWSSILRNMSWSIQSLFPEEFKKYVDRVCERLKYKVIKYPKNTQKNITVITDQRNKWDVIFNNMLRGQRCSLDTNASFGERCLNELFKLNDIKFEYQKTIYYQDGSHQYMDFYLPDYNMCIEYMGEQHYRETSRTNLKNQNQQDLKKYKYCKENNIKYCEIPFIHDSIKSICKYIEKKVLFKKIQIPLENSVQYSRLYEDKDIINLFIHDIQISDIAKKYNISNVTVINTLERHNIARKSKRKPVIQLSKSNNIINIFESAHHPMIILGNMDYRNISAACNGKRKTAYGYKWMFLSAYREQHLDLTDEDVKHYVTIKSGDQINV